MDDVRWEAPGAGRWDLDLSHCLGSMTPLMQHVHGSGMRSGMRELFETYGMPLDTIDARFVNGYFYSRLRPLISPDKVSAKAPPAIVLKVAFKLHPELRRRSKQAEATLADKPWRAAIREWESTERATFERENLALQDVDLAALDTDGLAAHYEAVLGALLRGYHRHFVLHGYDLGPIGLLLVEARRWHLAPEEIVPALQGASPSTSEPARILGRLRGAVAASGTTPVTLDDVRAISPEAAAELDQYLRYRGSLVFSRYDIDGVTMGELPDVVLAAILEGRDAAGTYDPEAVAGRAAGARTRRRPRRVRRAAHRGAVRHEPARRQRPDDGRVAHRLDAGDDARGRSPAHRPRRHRAARATPSSSIPVRSCRCSAERRRPRLDTIAARAERRRYLSTLSPPPTLGPEEPQPPASVIPKATATLMDVTQTVLALLATQPRDEGLHGTGVGAVTYRGTVRKALNPEEAIATLEPGEVLVVPFTTPAYNVVLPLAGGIVTIGGGPLSHAAVLARELGIPAVVGASGALEQLTRRHARRGRPGRRPGPHPRAPARRAGLIARSGHQAASRIARGVRLGHRARVALHGAAALAEAGDGVEVLLGDADVAKPGLEGEPVAEPLDGRRRVVLVAQRVPDRRPWPRGRPGR